MTREKFTYVDVEVFYVMAMSGLHSLTGETEYRTEAVEMMERILTWTGPGAAELGRPQLSGDVGGSSLAVPMCLLSLLSIMRELGWDRPGLEEACVAEVLSHVVRKDQTELVLETVGAEGQQLAGVAGRLVNPGHVIECGWFLLELASRSAQSVQSDLAQTDFSLLCRNNDQSLAQTSIKTFIEAPLQFGWDQEDDGIFYFLDADGINLTL